MYYYQETKKNYFELKSVSKDKVIQHPRIFTCHILDETISFVCDFWGSFENLPIKKIDGEIMYQRYHTCSNSVIGESLILLLEALGYKPYSSRGADVRVNDGISIPVYPLSSTTSIFVKIDKTEENLKKITKLPYWDSQSRFFSVYCSDSVFSNYIEPFIKNDTLFVTCGNNDGTFLETIRLERSLDFIKYQTDIKWKYVFVSVIGFLEEYFQSLNIKGRKRKFNDYGRKLIKKSCSETEAVIIFNDYLNELIQKKIINKVIRL